MSVQNLHELGKIYQAFELLQGDCLQQLATLPESSVQCCVTSPPYWGLRDYGTATWDGGDAKCDHLGPPRMSDKTTLSHPELKPRSQILAEPSRNVPTPYARICGKCGAKRVDVQLGLEATPDEYVANMVAVFREVRRVLRDDGTLWLNLGDSYSGVAGSSINKERSKTINFATLPKRKDLEGGLKHKDLAGIPWRVAFALQADGWWLRQDIIWHKPNPMPESVTDRCTKSHEYIFLLTKSARYYYDNEAVKERGVMAAGDSAGSMQRDTQETHGLGGGNSGINLAKQKLAAELQENGYSMRNKRSVWTVTTKPFRGAHFATFPPDLIEPCILAGSAAKCCAVCYAPWERVVEQGLPAPEPAHRNPTKRLEPGQAGNADAGNMGFRASKLSGQEMSKWKAENPDRTVGWEPRCECGGETQPSMVLDPFSGAGTTGVVAVQHGRRYIGIELNPEYLEMSRKRIQLVRDSLTVSMFADA